LEGAIAIAQQHAHTSGRRVATVVGSLTKSCDDQIGLVVAIDIPDRDRKRLFSTRVVTDSRLERSVSVAEQHGDDAVAVGAAAAGTWTDYDYVEIPITVDVLNGDGVGIEPT